MKEDGVYEKSTDYYGIEDYDDFSGLETEFEGQPEVTAPSDLFGNDFEEVAMSAAGLQQQYYTPLGKTPNADELSYYKFDTDKKQ